MDLPVAALAQIKSEHVLSGVYEGSNASRGYSAEDRLIAAAVAEARMDARQDSHGQPRTGQKSANSKPSSTSNGNAASGRKDWRFCHHAGCTKYRQCSQQNVFKYCATHMPLYGLKLKLFAPKICKVEDCTKVVTKGPDGTRVYCKLHLEELVLGVPVPPSAMITVPQRPARKRRAPLAFEENNFLHEFSDEDAEHNDPNGSPVDGAPIRRAARSFHGIKRKRLTSTCEQEWGVKAEQSEENDRARETDEGKRKLPAHLASIFANEDEVDWDDGAPSTGGAKSALVRAPPGMGHPNNNQRCRHPGCCKYAQYSVQRVRLYCSQHMRAHGLEPMNWDKQPSAQFNPPPSSPPEDFQQLDHGLRRSSKRKARPLLSLPLSPQSLPPLPMSDLGTHHASQQQHGVEPMDLQHLASKRARLCSPHSSASTATQLDPAAHPTNNIHPSQSTPTNTPSSWQVSDPTASLPKTQHNPRRALLQSRSNEDNDYEPKIARAGSGTLSQLDSEETGVGEEWEQGQDEKDQSHGVGWSLRSSSARNNKQLQSNQKRKPKGPAGATPKHCQAGGCSKQVQTCVDGSRLFCWVHMRERGLTPMYLNYNPGVGVAKKRGHRGHKASAHVDNSSQQQAGAVRQSSSWPNARTAAGTLPNSTCKGTKAAMRAVKSANTMQAEQGWPADNQQDQGSGSETMHQHTSEHENLDVRARAVSPGAALVSVPTMTFTVMRTAAARSVRSNVFLKKEPHESQEMNIDEQDCQDKEREAVQVGMKDSSSPGCRKALVHADLEAAAILGQLAGNRHALALTNATVGAVHSTVQCSYDGMMATAEAQTADRGIELGQGKGEEECEEEQEAPASGSLGHNAGLEGQEAEPGDEEEEENEQDMRVQHAEQGERELQVAVADHEWDNGVLQEEQEEEDDEEDKEEQEEHIEQQTIEQVLLRKQLLHRQREVALLRAKLQRLQAAVERTALVRQGTCEHEGGSNQSAAQIQSLAARVSSLEMELDRSRAQCRKLEEKLERSWAQGAELEAELRRTVEEHQHLQEELESAQCVTEPEKKKAASSLAALQAECRLLRSQQRQLQRAEESARALLQEQQEQWKRREAALQGQVRAFREENLALQKALRGQAASAP